MTSVAYVCVKPFTIAKVDEDGFTVDSERVVAKKGSIWYLVDKDTRMVGGAESVYLENSSSWIEITQERFQKCFRKVENNA